jgi:hypothetical protein
VPQGSILGPLLLLIYINDLKDEIQNCTLYLYADDWSLFLPVGYNETIPRLTHLIQSDLNRLERWSEKWKLKFKASKSKEVIFHSVSRTVRNFGNLTLNKNPFPEILHINT